MRHEDEKLIELLRAAGRGVQPQADLEDVVVSRIGSEPRPAEEPHRRRVRWPVFVIVPALLLGGCMSIPQVRNAVLDLFHLRGITVMRGSLPPSPSPDRSPPVSAPAPGQVGTRTTVASVEKLSHGSLLIPKALGNPKQVWRQGTVVNLLYGANPYYPSYVITEVLEPSRPLLEKIITSSTLVRRVQVGGAGGYWIVGPQGLAYIDKAGVPQYLPSLFGANSLLWDTPHLTARIETFQPERAAVAVARSMR
jgi:hypothetical protein